MLFWRRLRNLSVVNRLDGHMREVVRGALIALVIKALAAVAGFSLNVVIARKLGASGAGMFFQALTAANVAAVIGRMGFSNALVRFTAASAQFEKWPAVKGLHSKAIACATVVSLVLGIAMAVFADFLAEVVFSEPGLAVVIRYMSFAVVPLAVSFLYASLLKGLRRIGEAVFIESFLISALAVVGVLFAATPFGVSGAVFAYVFSAMVTLLTGYVFWRRATPQLASARGKFDTRTLFRSSFPILWVNIFHLIMSSTSIVFLGMWKSSAEVSLFAVANRTAMLTTFILVAVNSIAAPKFAALHAQNDMRGLRQTASHSSILMIGAAAPVLAIFVMFPHLVMQIFGPEFKQGAAALTVISIGQFINVCTGSVQGILMMCGQETVLQRITASSAIANLLLNVLLIPPYGVIGAALATSLSIVMQNLLSALLVRKKLGFWVIPWRLEGGLGPGV